MDRFKFRVYFEGRFIYKSLCDSNVYTDDDKCICRANNLPDLPWEQCTGLKDKNGKLIYEGDIIELTRARNYGYIPRGTKLVIKWNTFDCCGFSTGVRGNLTKKCADNCIVIGNIHKNANLLGEE